MAASNDFKSHLMFKTNGSFVIENWNKKRCLMSTVVKVPQISGQWSILTYSSLGPQLYMTLESNNEALIPIEMNTKTCIFAVISNVEAHINGKSISISGLQGMRNEIGTKKTIKWYGSIRQGSETNGKLEIKCTLSVFMEIEEKSMPIWIVPTKDLQLESDFLALYADDDLKDFTFKVGHKEFKVHKLVLSRASPVFKTMFTCGLDETKLNFAMIEECEPEVFEIFLQFLYAGKTPEDLRSVSMQLYELANRYTVPRLGKICLDDINETEINKFNALKLYEFAIKFEFQTLMNSTWEFIKEQMLEIGSSRACEPKSLERINDMLEAKDEYEKKLESFIDQD